ncbi:hypothetical protein BTVI_57274 [Pitangus sulphuratus]|nr:hypothetical protein BTVI_57274 [Pitangus sulphuratus]
MEIILLAGYQIERAYDLAVLRDVHPPEIYDTQKSLNFLLAGQWGHCCDLIDDFSQDLTMSILPLYSQELDLLGRSLDLTLLDGKPVSQENLDDFLSFLTNLLYCVPPYNDVINLLQVFWSITLL